MFKILGKHAIKSACNNIKRKYKTFYGSRNTYNELQLDCPFQISKEEFLEVKELYISSSLDEVLSKDKVVLLDSLEDPHNLGSIIRSAAILDYGVLIRKNKGCPINQTVIKCASGGIDNTYIMEITNLQEILSKVKERNFWIYALSENGALKVKRNEKILLVVGSEGSGLKNLTKKNCDYFFKLKGAENFHTYNASVAAAISMYEFCQTWDLNP